MKTKTALSGALLLGFTVTLAAQAPPATDCPEVFVQDYEYDDGGAVFKNLTPCPGDDLQGSPAYPVQTKTVHKEYERGEFYAAQISNEWHWEPSGRADCVHITRRVTHLYRKVADGADESAQVDQDGTKRSRETGESYAGGFAVTSGAKSRLPRNAPGSRVENTRFGIQCMRLDRSAFPIGQTIDGCLPILSAPKCKLELHLMPIETLFEAQSAVRMRGRTTHLEILPNSARLDRAGWVMP